MDFPPLRLCRGRPLDIRKSKPESGKECSAAECDTDDQTFTEARDIGFTELF
jgi:hypothetical protein